MIGDGKSCVFAARDVWTSYRPRRAPLGIRTDLHTYLSGATALAEGLRMRATGRLGRGAQDTVKPWLPGRGPPWQGVMNYCFRNRHLHACPWAALWPFSDKKAGHLPPWSNGLKSPGRPGAGWPAAKGPQWCPPGWWGSAPCALHAAGCGGCDWRPLGTCRSCPATYGPYHPSDSTAVLSISTATARWINSIRMIKRAADFLRTRMPSTPAKGPWVTRTRIPSTKYGCGS